MKKKKIKKKVIIIILFIIVLLVVGIIFLSKKTISSKENVKEAKVVSKISNYGYTLKDNKSKEYKKLFKELKEILSEEEVDEEKYVKQITKMFIVDFYSLNDRAAKTDVGGVDFVHEGVLDNFILNAEDTFYKYVESNIYKDRKQKLPIVDKITIDSVKNEEYSYLDQIDDNAFIVTANWTYKDEEIAKGYQNSGVFTFVHNESKLCLVELNEE